MTDYTPFIRVDKGVPLPEGWDRADKRKHPAKREGRVSPWIEFFKKCEAGDSFVCPFVIKQTVKKYANLFGFDIHMARFSPRSFGPDGMQLGRVWLISRPVTTGSMAVVITVNQSETAAV